MSTVLAGRYRVGDVIGRGGMGDVRAATDEALERPVAIKLMRADLAEDPGMRRQFEREGRAAARVSHPNVVAIHDVGECEGIPFIVMERLPGRTLADELAAGPLAEARVRAVATEMLSALAAAHDLGVIHRDIKPGNVLVREDGHIAIADFGIATFADAESHPTTGLMLGTAQYLAPERLHGASATPATDVYSVGVVMFEALTGRPAFRAETPLALAAAVASETPAYTTDERSRLDPRLLTVVDRAIAKDPRDRFASATEMRSALDPGADPRTAPTAPVHGAAGPFPTRRLPLDPPDPESTPAPTTRRRRRRVGLAAVVAAAAVTGAVIAATGGADSSPPPSTSTTSTSASTAAIPAPLRNAIDDLDRAVGR